MLFDFEVTHRAGFKHYAADVLSQPPTNGADDNDIEDDIQVLDIQQHSCEEKLKQSCNWTECDKTTKVFFEPYPIMRVKFDDVEFPTGTDLILAERKNDFCDQMEQLVGETNCLFTFDKNGLFVRKAPFDGSLPKLVPLSLHTTILHLTH